MAPDMTPDDDAPQGIDEWIATLKLIALLAPMSPEERRRAIKEVLERLENY